MYKENSNKEYDHIDLIGIALISVMFTVIGFLIGCIISKNNLINCQNIIQQQQEVIEKTIYQQHKTIDSLENELIINQILRK